MSFESAFTRVDELIRTSNPMVMLSNPLDVFTNNEIDDTYGDDPFFVSLLDARAEDELSWALLLRVAPEFADVGANESLFIAMFDGY